MQKAESWIFAYTHACTIFLPYSNVVNFLTLPHIHIDLLANPADCKGALDNGHNINGVYRVQPDDLEAFDVSYYHGYHDSIR